MQRLSTMAFFNTIFYINKPQSQITGYNYCAKDT